MGLYETNRYRKAKGMTQEKAAEELNISIEHLGNMERGQGKPSLELLVEIALNFHVSTDYLLLGRELDRDSVRVSLIAILRRLRPKCVISGGADDTT